MQIYCTFVLFVNQHFPGATRDWDALYNFTLTAGMMEIINNKKVVKAYFKILVQHFPGDELFHPPPPHIPARIAELHAKNQTQNLLNQKQEIKKSSATFR
jgi:hypothetical protein